MWTRALSLFVLLGAAACGSDVDDRPVSWAYIHPAIILPNCARAACHSSLTRTKTVDLEDSAKAYETMKGANIIPLLEGTQLIEGSTTYEYRMPPDQPLPNVDIDLIDRWQKALYPR